MKKLRYISGYIIKIILILLIIFGYKSFYNISKVQAAGGSVRITYVNSENSSQSIIQSAVIDSDINGALLIDWGTNGTLSWDKTDIEDTYIDENGQEQTAIYESTFAGWKLKSINGTEISTEYYYTDNDYIYLNDEPFVSYGSSNLNIEVEAVYGKVVYVRDKYNFRDITNVFGYQSEGSTGDILTAKIDWDKSTEYGSNYNSGATAETPVATLDKAYSLFKNSYGGKINIVNHITLEGNEIDESYSPTFANKGGASYFYLGNSLNIKGVVTISGKNLGGGSSIENKVNAGGSFANSYMYVKNTRGAGIYNGKTTYTSNTYYIYFYTNTVFEDFGMVAYRENYNSLGARQTSDLYLRGTFNKRFLTESTFKGYKRNTTQAALGRETGNWGFKNVTVDGVSRNPLAEGMSGCTDFYVPRNYTLDGKSYTVKSTDNIYINMRGGSSWYNFYGFYGSTGYEDSMNNIHINTENVSLGTHYSVSSSKKLNCNEISVRSYNCTITTLTPNYNAILNVNKYSAVEDNISKTTSTVYLGGYNTSTDGNMKSLTGNVSFKLISGKITNFYGGGNQIATIFRGNSNIIINGGTITNLYGGGMGGFIGDEQNNANINIDINGGTITSLYGGGSGGPIVVSTSSSPTDLMSYTKYGDRYYYNSSNKMYATNKEAFTTKNNDEYKFKDTNYKLGTITLKEGTNVIGTYETFYTDYLYPNGEDNNLVNYYRTQNTYAVSDAAVFGDICINLNSGANVKDVYGGGNNGAVTGNIEINVSNGAKVSGSIYGGGNGQNDVLEHNITSNANVKLRWTNSTEENVANSTNFAEKCNTEGTAYKNSPSVANYPYFMLSSEFKDFYQQPDGYVYIYTNVIEKLGLIDGNTNINVSGGTITGNIFGGSRGKVASVSGDSTINMTGGTVNNVYGGGDAGVVTGTNLNISNSTIKGNVYGGGNSANILGDSSIIINNMSKFANVYGGGYSGNVAGSSSIEITSSSIGNVYGGGYSGDITGSTNINVISGAIDNLYSGGYSGNIEGSTLSNISSSTIGNVFGGGYSGYVGGDAVTTIESGTYRNVFGGGDQSYVSGNVELNIGSAEDYGVNVTELAYGGGKGKIEAGQADARNFETVKGDSVVMIQGTKTNVENYGSVTLGKVTGDVDVTFKDYWTGNATAKYKTMNGIDRATTVIFDNSYVLLENKNQTTGQLEGIKSIVNLVIPEGSGLKISADGEITGNYEGGGELYLDSEVCLTVQGNITGETTLVLNPLLLEETSENVIKGGINFPYMKVKGTAPAQQAVISGEPAKYEILEAGESETQTGYKHFYIENDIIISNTITVSSKSVEDRKYLGDISGSNNVIILNNEAFSCDINLDYNLTAQYNERDMFSNITRDFVLKINNNTNAVIPKGTEILMINGDEYYSYIVPGNTAVIELSNFVDNNGNSFNEIIDFNSSDDVDRKFNVISKITEYKLLENYRFIVNFSNCDNKITAGTYYPMINVLGDGARLDTYQTDVAINTVKILNDRTYLLDGNISKVSYEPRDEIVFNGSLNVSEIRDYVVGENTDVYAKIVLYKVDENNERHEIAIPYGTVVKAVVDGDIISENQVLEQYSYVKLIDNINRNKVSKNVQIYIDTSDIILTEFLDDGNYVFDIQTIVVENENIVDEFKSSLIIPFEIENKYGTGFGIKALVKKVNTDFPDQIMNVGNSYTKNILLSCDGDIDNFKIVVTAVEKIGVFTYGETENTLNNIFYQKNITEVKDRAEFIVDFDSELHEGTYRIVFSLYNKDDKLLSQSYENFIVK